jgi:hypothetical protein
VDEAPETKISSCLFRGEADLLAEADFSVIYPDGKSALGIRADPGFVPNAGAIPAVIGQRQKNACVTFLTLRKPSLHTSPPPSKRLHFAHLFLHPSIKQKQPACVNTNCSAPGKFGLSHSLIIKPKLAVPILGVSLLKRLKAQI